MTAAQAKPKHRGKTPRTSAKVDSTVKSRKLSDDEKTKGAKVEVGQATEVVEPKPKLNQKTIIEPKVEQIKLAVLEAEIVATLSGESVDPDTITKDTLKRWTPMVDEGRLYIYTAARYGSAHDHDWISVALVARVRKAVAAIKAGADPETS